MAVLYELSGLKCRNKQVLEQLIVLIAPFAPHIAEELWEQLGHNTSVCDAQWPLFEEKYLVEDNIRLSISFNGKTRFTMDFAADADQKTIEEQVLADEQTQKYIDGKQIVKIIVVPKRIVNIVVK